MYTGVYMSTNNSRICSKCGSDDIFPFKVGTVTTRIRCKVCQHVWSHGAIGHSRKRVRSVVVRGEVKREEVAVPRMEKAAEWTEDKYDRRASLGKEVHSDMGVLHDDD